MNLNEVVNVMKKLEGIYPALITPFDENGQVNTDVIQKLVENLCVQGVDGFYIGGSTGESYLLSSDERKIILEAVKEASGEKQIIANIGMLATEHSLELARHAEKVGVTAISSVPPFYFPFTMEEYQKYYEDLSEAVDIPVLIYNIPAMSGVKFSTKDMEQLLSNKRIMGVKYTSYDLFQLQLLIKRFPEKTMFIGHDELFLSAIAIGVTAGIGSTYNIMADKFLKLMDYFNQKQLEQALEIQREINGIVEVLCKVGIFKGIKEILKIKGFNCGQMRKPFQPLDEESKKLIYETIEKYQL